MASSDEEGEILPVCVTNYLLENDRGEPISFAELPLHWSDQEKLIDNRGSPVVTLRGTTDEGLQSIYKEVIAWKLELSHVVPKMYMLTKGKTWIQVQLQQPRPSYGNVIKSVLVVVRCLHFAKRNADATRDQISSHVVKSLRSYDVVEPVENYLSAHLQIIQSAVAKDNDLAKSKYLKTFLMEIENLGSREYHLEENQTKNKSKLIVSDDEEPEEETDAVCAYCDNGGFIFPCEGQCMRSFHPTIDAGADTNCESLGFSNAAQYEGIRTFICGNCKHQKHQCFVCGKLGSSDKSSTVEVFPCVSATCGHFYHPACVAKALYPSDEPRAKKLQSQIAAGESFTCPAHKCRVCNLGENKEVHDLQFAVCRRCPKAYHRKCLPRKIAFEASADGSIEQRAWDGLSPKRILIYCMKHAILPELGTPKRDHLLFPRNIQKRNQEGSRIVKMTVRRSKAFGNLIRSDNENIPKVVERQCNYNTITYGNMKLEKGKPYTKQEKRSSIENNPPISRKPEQTPTKMQSKSAFRGNMQTSKSLKKIIVETPPVVDTDMKTRNFKNSFIKMNTAKIFITTCAILFIWCTLACTQEGYGATTLGSGYGASILALLTPIPILAPAPAPLPLPEYVNLTDLLTVAGPFSTFLKYLESTKLIETLQIQANDTAEGITLFVPKDSAFSNLKKLSLSNLTSNQLKQLCLFHALPHYYSLSEFKTLSGGGPVNTLAGGSYTLSFTDEFGTIHIGSGWTNTVVSSSVHVKGPVAIYQVNRVLLPEAIFGTNIPPPAPVQGLDVAPVTDGWIGGLGRRYIRQGLPVGLLGGGGW